MYRRSQRAAHFARVTPSVEYHQPTYGDIIGQVRPHPMSPFQGETHRTIGNIPYNIYYQRMIGVLLSIYLA